MLGVRKLVRPIASHVALHCYFNNRKKEGTGSVAEQMRSEASRAGDDRLLHHHGGVLHAGVCIQSDPDGHNGF